MYLSSFPLLWWGCAIVWWFVVEVARFAFVVFFLKLSRLLLSLRRMSPPLGPGQFYISRQRGALIARTSFYDRNESRRLHRGGLLRRQGWAGFFV